MDIGGFENKYRANFNIRMKKYNNFKLFGKRPLKGYAYEELIQMLSLKYEQASYDHREFWALALEELLLSHSQPTL